MPGDKPPMPESLRALATAAQGRVRKRKVVGPIAEGHVHREHGYLASPYADDDWELWVCLLLDAFGTRAIGCAQQFMRQLRDIVPSIWSREFSHHPDPFALEQALHIVCALKPRDEAETALCVQAVAVHFAAMKVTERQNGFACLDARTASSLAQLTKTFAAQIKALREMQRPGRARRQIIKVQKNVTINYRDEKHLHVPPGEGGGDSGGRSHATRPQRAHATPADEPIKCSALPCPDTGGEVVSFACPEGQEALPHARLGRCSAG